VFSAGSRVSFCNFSIDSYRSNRDEWNLWLGIGRFKNFNDSMTESLTDSIPLDSVRPLADERQELLPRFFLFAEAAEHRGRDRRGMLLLYPAHHHA
jgi:hypothetical protein